MPTATAAYDFYLVKGDLLPVLGIQLQDSSGKPVDLTNVQPNGVTFVMTDTSGTPVVSRPVAIDNAALGQIHYTWQAGDTARPGSYRAKFVVAFGAGPQTFPSPNGLSILIRDEQPTDPLSLASLPYLQPAGGGGPNFTTGGYPYPTGYARVDDVVSRINAGSWSPDDPTASPNRGQVEQWLLDATAMIDAAIATRGYYTPLQPMAGWLPPAGMPMWNGLGIGAWMMLRSIAAAYAVHYVEATRHGGTGRTDNDANSTRWMAVFDDFLTRIESGADNLEAFGVGGPFAPDLDPAHAAASGSLGFMANDTGRAEGPMFSKYENMGSGWESAATMGGLPPRSQ